MYPMYKSHGKASTNQTFVASETGLLLACVTLLFAFTLGKAPRRLQEVEGQKLRETASVIEVRS